jgi:hypothetical protein
MFLVLKWQPCCLLVAMLQVVLRITQRSDVTGLVLQAF